MTITNDNIITLIAGIEASGFDVPVPTHTDIVAHHTNVSKVSTIHY
jgi:hypothetical protein